MLAEDRLARGAVSPAMPSRSGKVAIVAGVGSGLGTALVDLLASAGWTVVAVARHREALESLTERGRTRGWSCETAVADLADRSETSSLVDGVRARHGRLDGVAVLAGRWTTGSTLLHELSEAQWSQGLADNLQAVFQVGRAVLPAMAAQRHGSIVYVSATGPVRMSGTASYAAAKAAIVEIGRKLAHDYRPDGIRVNVVLPGTMEHAISSQAGGEAEGPVLLRDDIGSGAWEVARAVRFLLSDDSRWITGAAIPVDGGRATGGAEMAVR